MIKKNIYKNIRSPLQSFKDKRGLIVDVFYKKNISHVAIISSKPNVIRGNHFHKKTTQYILITKGSLVYWYKDINDKKSKHAKAKIGDLIETPPYEIHALEIGKAGNEFLVFSEGLRGGKDYEKDTFRVESIIEKKIKNSF
tara:strand:+ start:289 stop:711 length:423 start_codon:yes stop_codon:yes gene_type:complete